MRHFSFFVVLVVAVSAEGVHDASKKGSLITVGAKTTATEIEFPQVGNIVSQALGLLPISSLNTPSVSQATLWQTTKSVVVLAIAGEDAESLPGVAGLGGVTPIRPLSSSPVASIAAAYVGRMVSEADASDRNIELDDLADGEALHGNLADLLAQSTGGQSLIVSASASRNAAARTGVTGVLARSHREWMRHFAVHLDERGFISDAMALVLRSEDFETHKADPFLNPSVAEDRAFLAELSYLATLADRLAGDYELTRLLNDDVPDLISLPFVSLQGLRVKYGARSSQYRVALELLNTVAPRAMEQLRALRPDTVALVVLTGDEAGAEDEARRQAAQEDGARLRSLRSGGSTLVSPSPRMGNVTCVIINNATNATNCTYTYVYDDSYSGIYQALVWGTVVLVLILWCSACALYNMHIPRDSLLYAEVLHSGKVD